MTSSKTHSNLRYYQVLGLLGLMATFGSIGAWAALSNIRGAVIAPGLTVVESYVKRIQHREGGIVSEISIKEGTRVKAGDVLIKLDQTETKAELEILQSSLEEFQAQRARLRAERDGKSKIEFPEDLLKKKDNPRIADLILGQEKLFTSELAALNGRKEQLTERIGQLNEQINGLTSQIASKEEQVRLISGEVKDLKTLQEQGLVPVSRILALEREQARLEGDKGELVANIAAAKGRMGETKLQIIQIEDDFRTRLLADLREAEAKVNEIRERLLAATDKLKRTTIRAPLDGVVQQLAVHTIGGVIGPGENVMLVVPELDELVIEARVRPEDIDQIAVGQTAIVRFPVFNQRTTPQVVGEVTQVSPDLTRTQENVPPYYSIRLRLTKDQIERLGDVKLKPGMPAEAFIQTDDRTPLSYLLRPLTDQFARTFREQ